MKALRAMNERLGFSPLGWLRNTLRLHRWARRCLATAPDIVPTPKRVAVVIAPWQGTSVPWFTLAIGLLIRRRGHQVTFVFDDSTFGVTPRRFAVVRQCLSFVLSQLSPACDVLRLSTVTPVALEESLDGEIDRLAQLNVVWALRGEMLQTGRAVMVARYREQLAIAAPRLAGFFACQHPDFIFIPGGVFGTSGLWVHQARRNRIRLGSFDAGGYGTLLLACDGVACQLQDIPSAYRWLVTRCAADEQERQFVMRAAIEEIAKRRGGKDKFSSQVADAGDGDDRYSGAVLITLNSSWDAAALGLHTLFPDNTSWIIETVRYLLDHTEAPVVVRQHPAERLPIARTSEDYRALLAWHFAGHPRLHFIAAEQQVNSYALVERAAAVVAYTSTIGIEATALGKPVVTESSAYYANLGFVWRCDSLTNYHARLRQAAAGSLIVSTEMREAATLCYYLTQCCNWVFTDFNPVDLGAWCMREPAALEADATVQRVLESLLLNMPVAQANHLRALATPTAVTGPAT